MGDVVELDELLTTGQRSVPLRRVSRVHAVAKGWLVGLSAWLLLGLIQLPAAAGLIELEGLKRGSPINMNDHFSSLPELKGAFDTANLGAQHLYFWILVMFFFAISGLLLAVASFARKRALSPRMAACMASLWVLAGAVALAHRETLDLIVWLDN